MHLHHDKEAFEELIIGAKDGININNVLQEIVDTEAYKNDYDEITSGLLFTPLEYDEVVTSIREIIMNQNSSNEAVNFSVSLGLKRPFDLN